MLKSRWQDIYAHLKSKGFDVYSPAQKTDECDKPYVVIKDNGILDVAGISSRQHLFELLAYTPKDNYSEIEPFVDSLESCMEGLYPMIRPLRERSSAYYDDTVKAHMVSLSYVNYRKCRR